MKNARNILVTGLAIIAAVVVLGVWKGYIPPKAGTEGAIGAAQRYTSPQITDSDVQLGDASIQAFLQSDVFHAIATNPDFRNLVTKDAFKKSVQVEGMLSLASHDFARGGSKDFQKAVTSEALKNVTTSKDFRAAIGDQKVQAILANEDFQKLVGQPEYQKYVADQLKGVGKDQLRDQAQATVKSKEWKALEANAEFKAALANQDFLATTAHKDFVKLLGDYGKLFANTDFDKMLSSRDFQTLVASKEYRQLVGSTEYLNVISSHDFQKAAGTKEFQKLVHADLAAAVASADMSKAQTEK